MIVFYVLNERVAFGPRLPNVFLNDDCRSRLWSAAFPCLFRYCKWKFDRLVALSKAELLLVKPFGKDDFSTSAIM